MNQLSINVPVSDMERMASAIASSGLFGIRDKNQALALMIVAQAEGRHPGKVASDYHIIQGKAALKADTMLARYQEAGGKVEWHTLTDERADATFSHPSAGSLRIDWTLARAKTAGLLGNAMWTKYPRAMLRSRCVSEGVRSSLPGVLGGMYEVSEVRDMALADDTEPKAASGRGSHNATPPPINATLTDVDLEAEEAAPEPVAPVNWREVRVHFGTNEGRRLAELQPHQRHWYLTEWMPKKEANGVISQDASRLIAALKAMQAAANDAPDSDDLDMTPVPVPVPAPASESVTKIADTIPGDWHKAKVDGKPLTSMGLAELANLAVNPPRKAYAALACAALQERLPASVDLPSIEAVSHALSDHSDGVGPCGLVFEVAQARHSELTAAANKPQPAATVEA